MAIENHIEGLQAVETFGVDTDGREYFLLVAKATYRWDDRGRPVAITDPEEALPVVTEDVYQGEAGQSSLLCGSELAPRKPFVDVLLSGAVVLPQPATQSAVGLQVGRRITKQVLVMGPRIWFEGFMSLTMTKPKAFAEMPITWEKAFGGMDPEHPEVCEPRNLAGLGMRKDPKSLKGTLAPNYEDVRAPIKSARDRPAPMGFGPVDTAWEPRSKFAGTYGDSWLKTRFPHVASDFNPRYHNAAPIDQQMQGYQPGEAVWLYNMTGKPKEGFVLPELDILAQIHVRGQEPAVTRLAVDTVVIEPKQRRFSLVARTLLHPSPDITAVQGAVVENREGATRAGWREGRP